MMARYVLQPPPNEEYFHDYIKKCVTLFMPAWSWEELIKYHKLKGPLSKINLNELRSRYDKFGGLINVMTFNQVELHSYEISVDRAIEDVANDIRLLKKLVDGDLRKTKETSHKLISFLPDEQFHLLEVVWLSKDITKKIVQKMYESSSNFKAFVSFINQLIDLGKPQAAGGFYENLVEMDLIK